MQNPPSIHCSQCYILQVGPNVIDRRTISQLCEIYAVLTLKSDECGYFRLKRNSPVPINMRATMMWLVLIALCSTGIAAPPAKFVKGCDDRLAPYLHSKIIGQHAALQLMADEICAHVEPFGAPPSKPLIFSLHGPSQVGKSESHRRIAQALYSATPEDHSTVSCMSHKQCPGYLVSASHEQELYS